MEQQQIDSEKQYLRRLVQELAELWKSDWDSADYPGKILPELIRNPSKRSKTENRILEGIKRVANFDDWDQLPSILVQEHDFLKIAPQLRAKLEQMMKHFQLARADAFLHSNPGILDKETYENLRKNRILRRYHSVKRLLEDFQFAEAQQSIEEACEVLRPNEARELQDRFQTEAARFARIYLKRHIVPLLERDAVEEARRKFEIVGKILDVSEYADLEATYAPKKDTNPFDDFVLEVGSLDGDLRANNTSGHSDILASVSEHKSYKKPAGGYIGGHTVNKTLREDNSWKDDFLVAGQSLEETRRTAIKLEVRRRKIARLVHFTRFSNLRSILEKGLLPRLNLERNRLPFTPNDLQRLDHMRNATSLSISFPNYKMFYKYRQQDPDAHWVILFLDPSILWEYTCFFFRANAASTSMQNKERFRKSGADAFVGLFSVLDGEPSRERTGIPGYYTTDPQAEVVVVKDIPPSKIQKVVVRDKETLDIVNEVDEYFPHSIVEVYFHPRNDWEYWQRGKEHGSETGFYSAPF